MDVIDLPMVAPERKKARMQPIKAVQHFRKLAKNKEDTSQVFQIIEAMKTGASDEQAWAFIQSEQGQRLIREGVDLPTMLDDHARWKDLPTNSLGRHYVDFMEAEGLSAQGLLQEAYKWAPPESRPNDQTEWYFNRLRDTHDLFHVLTTYGRDALGESSLLSFGYEQNPNLGQIFIGFAGARQVKIASGTKAPLFASIREAMRLGKAAAKIAHEDIEALMHQDIGEVRKRLRIGTPVVYHQCVATLKAEGFKEDAADLSHKLELHKHGHHLPHFSLT